MMTRSAVTLREALRIGPLRTGLWIVCLTLILAPALPALGAAPDDAVERFCDGRDDDGDGLIDEDFDTDGDGVARCCSTDPFFATLNLGATEIHAHHRACAARRFTPSLTAIAEAPPGDRILINGITEVHGNGTLAVFWTEVNSRFRNITHCNGLEWHTTRSCTWTYSYFGGAKIDADGTADFVGWDQQNGFVAGPVLGPGPDFGVTTLSSGFPELYGTYDTGPTVGDWIAARAYNLQDIDSDGLDDLAYHSYATGAASTTNIFWLPGTGTGAFGAPAPLGSVGNQPQNFGDLGFIDDCSADFRCADWIGGPDDDGNRGAIFALFGDCTGTFGAPTLVADVCPGACPGSGTGHGSGLSQLYDWDCDGQLELLASHTVDTGATASVTYFENDCGTFHTPVTVINAQPMPPTIASPLRN